MTEDILEPCPETETISRSPEGIMIYLQLQNGLFTPVLFVAYDQLDCIENFIRQPFQLAIRNEPKPNRLPALHDTVVNATVLDLGGKGRFFVCDRYCNQTIFDPEIASKRRHLGKSMVKFGQFDTFEEAVECARKTGGYITHFANAQNVGGGRRYLITRHLEVDAGIDIPVVVARPDAGRLA